MSTENGGSGSQFDRLRPRTAAPVPANSMITEVGQPSDREGKRALFSEVSAPPTMGSVALRCDRCATRTVVSWTTALRLAFPTVPALVPGSGMRVWMKCPSCTKRSWVSISTKH